MQRYFIQNLNNLTTPFRLIVERMDYSLSELPLVYDLVDIKILVWCIARLSLLPIMEFVGVIANVIRDIDGFADRAPRDQPD
ncbi:hypothetical protein HI914_00128 [Erysiphe necator]|nr:hypothetical protein HI914_00128 [Erysiphe necator]